MIGSLFGSIFFTISTSFSQTTQLDLGRSTTAVFSANWANLSKLLLEGDFIDHTFGNNGLVETSFDQKIIGYQSDGKIIAARYDETLGIVIYRLNEDFSPDGTFGSVTLPQSIGYGWVGLPLGTGVILPDDNILFLADWGVGPPQGPQYFLSRVHANGTWDLNFGTNGRVSISQLEASGGIGMIVQGGSVVLAGMTNGKVALSRFDATNGIQDTTFGLIQEEVSSHFPEVQYMGALSNGNILVYATDLMPQGFLLRFLPTGALDFKTTISLQDVVRVMTPDGKFLLVEKSITDPDAEEMSPTDPEAPRNPAALHSHLIRLNADGSPDTSFKKVDVNFLISKMTLLPDGRIAAAGILYDKTTSGVDDCNKSSLALALYNPDGSLDKNFSLDGIFPTDVGNSFFGKDSRDRFSGNIFVQPDGKVIISGETDLDCKITHNDGPPFEYMIGSKGFNYHHEPTKDFFVRYSLPEKVTPEPVRMRVPGEQIQFNPIWLRR